MMAALGGESLVWAEVPVNDIEPTSEAKADTVEIAPRRWQTDVVARISGSQTGFRNWAEGGTNSLASSANLSGKFVRRTPSWRTNHETRLAFGIVRQNGSTLRKVEDLIHWNTAINYTGNGFFQTFNPTLAFDVRTQFAQGFNYDRNPFNDGREAPVKVSDFFSPATLQQSIGLSYVGGPDEWFKYRLGFGSKQTIVANKYLRSLYGLDFDQALRYQIGMESRTEVNLEIATNVRYRSTLGLFAAFNRADLPDMMWENLVSMRVNSWLGVNFEFITYYDREVSDALQFKEVLSVGLTVVIV